MFGLGVSSLWPVAIGLLVVALAASIRILFPLSIELLKPFLGPLDQPAIQQDSAPAKKNQS